MSCTAGSVNLLILGVGECRNPQHVTGGMGSIYLVLYAGLTDMVWRGYPCHSDPHHDRVTYIIIPLFKDTEEFASILSK